jgi:hypothetical protein
VPLDRFEFPAIPNVTGPEGIFNIRFLYNRGPRYDTDDVSGIISVELAKAVVAYPALVPEVDNDRNDIDRLRSITLQAPWHIHGPERAARQVRRRPRLRPHPKVYPVCRDKGAAHAERRPAAVAGRAVRDPANYTALATAAADKLVAQRLLLERMGRRTSKARRTRRNRRG